MIPELTSLSGEPNAVNQPERPLLARVAESVYWCSRYVERAEHIARLLAVTAQLALDVGDLDRPLRDRLWLGLAGALELVPEDDGGPLPARVRRRLTAPGQDGGLAYCVESARNNARGVRGEISREMWEVLNELHWHVQGALGDGDDPSESFHEHVTRSGMLFQGATDQTLGRGRRWDFALAGRMLERADATCRIVRARAGFLRDAEGRLETPLVNIHLMAALRMCGSLEAYRRQHLNQLDPRQVFGFILLQADNPRSVRFAVAKAHQAVERIAAAASGPTRRGVDPAERALGRLLASLEYADVHDVARDGVTPFLDDVHATVAQANDALHRGYFLA